jgi:hypothetical protein
LDPFHETTQLRKAMLVLVSFLLCAWLADAHPTLVECVCATTRASDVVVSVPTPAAKGQATKWVLPSCVDDVFAETGIRWYTNGPVSGATTYWRRAPKKYTLGRAAQRLISLGYTCTAVELYDPAEIVYYT